MSLRGLTDWMSCRLVLNLMVITGFMLNYAFRVNLTIAIVAMVKQVVPVVNNSTLGEHTNITTNVTVPLITDDPDDGSAKYTWNEYEQNFILGSFFWGYLLTELPGGRLSELVGGRRVFGYSMLFASILTLITPISADAGYIALVILRAVLGFFLGASWPAIHPMTAVWIPPMDRSKFIANMMASALGAAITMPICGFLISYLGWASVFYFTGGVGLFWSILWFLVIFESPAAHPRISPEERKEIEDAIGASTSKKRPSYVPWKSIFLSPPVWAIIITHACSVFGYFLVVNQLPTYMKYILKFDVKANGLLSSLPYLGKYIMAIAASTLADHLRKTGKLTTTMARKLFTSFAVFTPGLFFILQVFVGHDRGWSVAIFTIALTLNGAVTAGYLGNGLDIAPNFSGTIFGMANTLSSFGGFVSSWMVGTLTNNNQTYGQWQIVFGILAATYIFGAIAYVVMGSGELQSWNNPPEKSSPQDVELSVPLKSKNNTVSS